MAMFWVNQGKHIWEAQPSELVLACVTYSPQKDRWTGSINHPHYILKRTYRTRKEAQDAVEAEVRKLVAITLYNMEATG